MTATALYFTDPLCPWSWAAEPARRRAEREWGGAVQLEYVMGGLAREFDDPVAQLRAWLDAAAASGMPADPRWWLDAPPKGSYAACLAVLVAAEQGRAGAYLRRAREAVALESRRLDHGDALLELARDVPGLDVERFRVGLASHAVLETFSHQLERTRSAGEGVLPRLEVQGPDGAPSEVRGADLLDAPAWLRASEQAGVRATPGSAPGVEQALREHGALATVEVAAACDLPGPRAAAELWRLAGDWKVRFERHLNGELWRIA